MIGKKLSVSYSSMLMLLTSLVGEKCKAVTEASPPDFLVRAFANFSRDLPLLGFPKETRISNLSG